MRRVGTLFVPTRTEAERVGSDERRPRVWRRLRLSPPYPYPIVDCAQTEWHMRPVLERSKDGSMGAVGQISSITPDTRAEEWDEGVG